MFGCRYDITRHGIIDAMHLLTNLAKHIYVLIKRELPNDNTRDRFGEELDERWVRVEQSFDRANRFPSRPALFATKAWSSMRRDIFRLASYVFLNFYTA